MHHITKEGILINTMVIVDRAVVANKIIIGYLYYLYEAITAITGYLLKVITDCLDCLYNWNYYYCFISNCIAMVVLFYIEY